MRCLPTHRRAEAGFTSRKENHSLAVQPSEPRDRPEAVASRKVESNDFILRHAIQPAARVKAQTPRLLKAQVIVRSKNPHQTAVEAIIFADARYRVWRPERMFTAHDDIAIRRDRQVERTELRILHLPRWEQPKIAIERQDGVVAFSARTNPGSEKKPAVMSEC